MNWEHSCGAVVYTIKNGEPFYVVVQQKAGNYSFPKGHMEKGESEIETARREIYEETGLTAVFRDGFREEEEYGVTGDPGARKRVTYYLAESEGGSLSGRQGEILQVRMLPYEEALKVFDRPATRRILTRANELLTGRPEKEWQIEFRTSHEKMIEAVLEKSRRSCLDGLDLLGVYGSAATGDMHDRSDLDLLIVPSGVEAGRQLSRTFILDDEQVGYDLYCTSWEALENDAECGHSQIGKLMDSVIVYAKDDTVRERLEELRSRASGVLASEERFIKAREVSERMRIPYADALLSGSMAEKRAYAAYVISLSLDAVMLYNGSYFRKGTKRTFEELEGLSLPEGFRDTINAVIQAGDRDTADAELTRLVRSVLSFTAIEEEKPLPDSGSLRGTYEEMVSNWRNKMTEAADNSDVFSSFMNMASLQFMLAGIAGNAAIPQFHVMKDFRADDLRGNAKAFDGILEEYLLEYEKAGMKPLIYGNADEFVRDYLGEN